MSKIGENVKKSMKISKIREIVKKRDTFQEKYKKPLTGQYLI